VPKQIIRSEGVVIIENDPDDIVSVHIDPTLIPANPQCFTEVKFAEIIGDALREWFCFVPGIGWHHWTGKYWKVDESGLLQKAALWAIRKLGMQTAGFDLEVLKKWNSEIFKMQNARKLRSILSLLEKPLPEVDLVVPQSYFDRSPVELNVANGILDLETGKLSPHDQERWLSHYVDIPYNERAPLPENWLAFLDKVFAGDQQLIAYIQFLFGYSLSGRTDPPIVPILYGGGQNGKSILLDVLGMVAGSYSTRIRAETIAAPKFAKSGSDHSEDVARLVGKRAVLCAEITHSRLNENLLKLYSSGDETTARRMREKEFRMCPVCKIWLCGNERPAIRGTDDGIWRRLKYIHFGVKIAPEERIDRHILLQTFRDELPAILAWAAEGYLLFMEGGEPECEAIEQETAEFRQQEDVIGGFLDECVEYGEELKARSSELYDAYLDWCRKNTHHPLSSAHFKSAVTERCLVYAKRKDGRYYVGGKLKDEF